MATKLGATAFAFATIPPAVMAVAWFTGRPLPMAAVGFELLGFVAAAPIAIASWRRAAQDCRATIAPDDFNSAQARSARFGGRLGLTALGLWVGIVLLVTPPIVSLISSLRVLRLTPTPQPIEASVEAGMELDGEPYMHSYWRVSRGAAVHATRKIRPDGSVRILIDDANGFSWDTVQLDLSRDEHGSIKAEAVVFWTKDFGRPFDGTVANLTGRLTVGSADWSGTQPLVVDFDIQGQGLDGAVRENGRVAVPLEEGLIGPDPRAGR